MRKPALTVWGKPVAGLWLGGSINTVFAGIVIKFNDLLHNLSEFFTGFMLRFSHKTKTLISSVKNRVIPIFHTTYNKAQQFKLTSY